MVWPLARTLTTFTGVDGPIVPAASEVAASDVVRKMPTRTANAATAVTPLRFRVCLMSLPPRRVAAAADALLGSMWRSARECDQKTNPVPAQAFKTRCTCGRTAHFASASARKRREPSRLEEAATASQI